MLRISRLRAATVAIVALALLSGTSAVRTEFRARGTTLVVDWHGGARRYRVPLDAGANGFARTDRVVEASLDLPALLAAAGGTGAVDLSSLSLVEVTDAGALADASVPFQFDGTATGSLVWEMEGATAANATRHYQLYFDTTSFVGPAFGDQVVVTDNVPDAGQSSFRVATGAGTYYFQKEAAGFSSLVDAQGNDWIGYAAGGGSAGEYRGIPNLVYPANIYHPGFTSASSALTFDGPLKATVESPSDNGQFKTRWEFYPGCARLTVLQATGNYWFLYEGTPGGLLDRTPPNNDFFVRSDGTQYSVTANWGAGQDIPGDEWVYFADPVVGRSLFLAHHTDDAVTDTYSALDLPAGGPDSDWMTVFGFGRSNVTSLLQGAPRQFTIGLIDTTQFAAAQPAIRSAYKEVTIQVGPAEEFAGGCGDGQIGEGEACDDGNTTDGDGCDADCVVEACGNGAVQVGEQCDDGNTDDLDACGNDCTANSCGDGETNNGEQCDDGAVLGGDGCDASCLVEACGNGVPQAGEECDDGNANDLDGCGNDCQTNECGDGEVNNGEQCDDGNAMDHDACRNNCLVPACRDGWLDPGEACDDGNANDLDGCGNDCVVNYCGDGEVNNGEPCDDGNGVDDDACSNACLPTFECDSAVLNGDFAAGAAGWNFFSDGTAAFSVVSGEARLQIQLPGTNVQLYEFGIAVRGQTLYRLRLRGRNTAGSDVNVALQQHVAPYAGYGLSLRLDLTPQMSDYLVLFTTPAGDRTDARLTLQVGPYDVASSEYYFDDILLQRVADCPYCGDAQVGIGEACDDGNAVPTDGCRNDCRLPGCGDGFLDPPEACDDGNAAEGDGCDSDCVTEACGNGILQFGEQCDDGDTDDLDACGNDCVANYCGDGVANNAEACDDGNADDLDACGNDCAANYCGDGVANNGEACDDGNADDLDACGNDCAANYCGDGVANHGEACDDGNADDLDACGNDCAANYCGDGVANHGEACDDGNADDTDGCRNDCTWNPCGASDADGDGINDVCDPDDDNDGTADGEDCAPLDGEVSRPPAEVQGLTVELGSGTLLAWGVEGPGSAYDVFAGSVADLARDGGAQGAICLVSSTTAHETLDPGDDPSPGAARYYLVRARNACGTGTFGFGSRGEERVPTATCE